MNTHLDRFFGRDQRFFFSPRRNLNLKLEAYLRTFPMAATQTKLRRNDWIRFQIPDKRVLEGFVQEVSADGTRIRVGKTPDGPENQWHNLADITVIKKQALMMPA